VLNFADDCAIAGNSGPPQNPLQEISANPDLAGLSPNAADPPPPLSPAATNQTDPRYPLENIVSIFPGAVLRESSLLYNIIYRKINF
jgi:hypothetical protein